MGSSYAGNGRLPMPVRYASKADLLRKLESDRECIVKCMEKAWRQYVKYPDRQWVVIYLDRYQISAYVVDFTLGIKDIMDVHSERYGIPLLNLNYGNCTADSELDYDRLWRMCMSAIEGREKIEKDYSVYVNPNGAQTGQVTLFG